MAIETLGFIGLGTMGLPMSFNLLKAGHELLVWGRSPEKFEDAIKAGAKLLDTPKTMAKSCNVIFLCVFDTEAVNDVVFGKNGIAHGASNNLIIVDHSSIQPDKTREMADKLKSQTGAGWVDCPVSGGR